MDEPDALTGEDPVREAEPANDGEGHGEGIVTLDFAGTGVFLGAATLATVLPDEVARPAAVVDVVLFAIGVVAFLWSYAIAVGRSRTEAISVAGLYFLADDAAPREVRYRFRIALAVQVVVALVSASIRPYTAVAFGVLVPVLGLGLMGLWGAKHGRFPPRGDAETS